ncbi:MAG: hypothetical protein R3190_14740 [Thermoanaerobaculia bacterium]|nr:hypothetical protein [Thermoanaerobaculia bacterium]
MPNGYSRSPLLLKGALVEFSERFLGPIPNIIIFQYNPESLGRSLDVWQPAAGEDEEGRVGGSTGGGSGTAQPSDPPETFTLELVVDATDELESGDPVAVITGVADRLAAMEMLLYPQEGSLLGDLLGSLSGSLSVSGGGVSAGGSAGAEAEAVPRGTVPIVLFVWGPGRIVPVRVTSFSVDEQAFSPILYPIRAKVSIGLKILTPDDLAGHPEGLAKDIAIGAFEFTRTQKKVLAAANLANSVESILGMLPF